MGTYIKYFETTAEYEAYTSDRPHFIKPNVSLTVDNSTVHYNHCVPPFCKLILNNGETVELEGSGGLTSTMTSPYKTDCVSAEIGTLCTSIGGWAFSEFSGLTSIDISNSVTSIGNSAFGYCSSLTSIDIPSGVTSIGQSVFQYCRSLTSIDIPSGVTSIGSLVFYQCTSLTSITVEATTPPTLGSDAFHYTTNCPIYVPCDSVDTYKATSGWSTYASRIQAIPGSCAEWDITAKFNVTDITNSTKIASNTSNITKIKIDNVEQPNVSTAYTFSTTGEHTVKYMLEDKTFITRGALSGCSNITSIDIQNGVETIYSRAFMRCSNLTSVTLPNSVTSIDEGAFYDCANLTNINIPSGVTNIGSGAFAACTSLTSIDIPSGVTSINSQAFNYCYSLTNIVIPDNVTSIGYSAFTQCTGLTSCTIGSGVTSISYDAFRYCSGLTSITINATTPPTLGNTVFDNTNNCPIYVLCDSVDTYKAASGWSTYASRIQAIQGTCWDITAKFDVTSVSSPTSIASGTTGFSKIMVDGVEMTPRTGYTFSTMGEHTVRYMLTDATSIGVKAFAGCFSLTSIDIPDSVTSIGNSAFWGCSGLTSIDIPSGVTSIGNDAFRYCTSLTSIDIPDSVTSIGIYAFQGCTSLTSCTIGDGVTSIGNLAFSSCNSLTSIDIPDSVTSIGNQAFYYCTSLTSCTIGSGVTTIGNNAFESCRSLTSIVIPDSVTTIEQAAFSYCSGMTTCTIGSGVTYIGSSAFTSCVGLTSVTVEATTPPNLLSSDVFYSTNDCPIYVPCDSVNAYKSAEYWSDYASRIKAIQGTCWDITAKFNVTSTSSPTRIASATTGFSKIEIDGVEQPSVTTGYTFSTTGEHTVKYYLKNTSIGESAFGNCRSLTSIDIPNSVTSIDYNAFNYCKSLTSCTIGSGVTSIGTSAFTSCWGLTSIVIPDNVTSIGSSIIDNCTGLTSVTIPDSVTSIGNYAFYDCGRLTSIDIPSGVTSIGGYAFYNCSRLTSITSNAVTAPTISYDTFYQVKTNGTLYVPIGNSGYDVWMGTSDYYLGKYGWTKVEQ